MVVRMPAACATGSVVHRQPSSAGIRGGIVCRPERGNVQQPAHALLTAGLYDFPRQFGVDAGEVAFAPLVQDAGQAHHRISSGDQARSVAGS